MIWGVSAMGGGLCLNAVITVLVNFAAYYKHTGCTQAKEQGLVIMAPLSTEHAGIIYT